MSLAVYFEESIKSLDLYVGALNLREVKLCLFTNDLEPDDETEIDAFTEATFGGYERQQLDEWPQPGATFVAPRAVTEHPFRTFTSDGNTPETIYGYFTLDDLGQLLFSERFAEPKQMSQFAGQSLSIKVQYTRRSEFHPHEA